MDEYHHAHIEQARAVFRSAGLDIAAMQYKRSPEALAALRKFNKAPEGWAHPFAWGYFPNSWCRDNWRTLYG